MRIDEILTKLNYEYGDREPLSKEEYEELQCKWANDNEGNLNEKDGHNCDKCKNKGIVYYLNEQRNLVVKDCECMKIRKTLRRAKASGLDNVLSDYTFAKYDAAEDWQKDIKNKAMEFCKDDNSNWFYIGGQTGAGKTHICTAIAGYYIKHGKDCRYMLWRDDAVKLKQLVNDHVEYQKMIEPLKNVDVLYIDDLFKVQRGAEPTGADINLAFELLNSRLLDSEKITIISSEFPIVEALQFDEGTIGRVYQQTGKYKIDIPRDIAKNYRLRG